MFERTLEECSAVVFIENGLHEVLTCPSVGVDFSIVYRGDHRYNYTDARAAISVLDDALRRCAKKFYKRIRAQRMSFVLAFGPEMEARVGPPPTPR
jgi:hypothetical protein